MAPVILHAVAAAALASAPCPEALEVDGGRFYRIVNGSLVEVAPCDGVVMSKQSAAKLADKLDAMALEAFEAKRMLQIKEIEAQDAERRAQRCLEKLAEAVTAEPVIEARSTTPWWLFFAGVGVGGFLVGGAWYLSGGGR